MSHDERWRRAYRREDTKEQVKRNIDSELEAHLDMRIEQLRAQGLSEDEARAQAQEMLGDVARAADACERTDRRWLLHDRVGMLVGSIVKDIGLWGPKVQKAFTEMGVHSLADSDIDGLMKADEDQAEQLDKAHAEMASRVLEVNAAIAAGAN